jgi:hypothetical protein
MKLTIIAFTILLASCTKEPVKECWTVTGYKMLRVVPSSYQVTLISNGKTKTVIQSSPPVIGSNTCGTGNQITNPFNN